MATASGSAKNLPVNDQYLKECSTSQLCETLPDLLPVLHEDVILVWIHTPDDSEEEEIFGKLQQLNKHIRIFSHMNAYEQFTRTIKDEKIFLIIPTTLLRKALSL